MRDLFLYEEMKVLYDSGFVNREIPDSITQNLNPQFEIRDYQEEALRDSSTTSIKNTPAKTDDCICCLTWQLAAVKHLSWRGLILYLYEKGYRNFLFFVNSTNIIKKTQENFLNPDTSKYLFNKEIYN